MSEKTTWESFKAEGANVMDKLKALVHEGNVRRVIIQHDNRTVAEFPLTAGVVGAVLAPPLAPFIAPVAWMNRVVTVGLLPAAIRTQYGFPWDAGNERGFQRVVAGVGRMRALAPRALAWWPEARRTA